MKIHLAGKNRNANRCPLLRVILIFVNKTLRVSFGRENRGGLYAPAFRGPTRYFCFC